MELWRNTSFQLPTSCARAHNVSPMPTSARTCAPLRPRCGVSARVVDVASATCPWRALRRAPALLMPPLPSESTLSPHSTWARRGAPRGRMAATRRRGASLRA